MVTGIITTIAGGGNRTGDNLPATQAAIGSVRGLALDSSGNLYVAEGQIVSRISANTGIRKIIAGSQSGAAADGIPAATANFSNPSGIWVDAAGNIYISDTGNNRIRTIRGPLP